jgi:dipeptidyl aminopeptidase/acylaminoacyl peptidase
MAAMPAKTRKEMTGLRPPSADGPSAATWQRPCAAALIALALLGLSFASVIARAPAQPVSFKTDDGVTVAATWHEPASRPAPAVIYVHMLQKSRGDWDPLAAQLAAEGIGGLTIDLRGHGETPGSNQDFAGMVKDVRAARQFLAGSADVTPGRIAIAGASIGATLAAQAAGDDPSIASLVLLSPSLDYRGLRLDASVKKVGARPVLLVASDDDGYAVRSVRDLEKVGGGRREIVILSRAGHGTAMLTKDPDLSRRLLEWFRRTLL